ncbi:FtsX-like permease family protein [Ilumatobacter sp.]|uniref:ABC transporter permease n=1 Tax=Ilumatobacter sp. TaxID=1967498 RepID=UPI003AF8F760
MLRQFRRAPGRIVASVFALALAVGAIGVLAIPTVSEGTLHDAVERDGLADIIVNTTPISAEQLAAVNELDGIVAAEAQSTEAVRMGDGFLTRMIGLDFEDQTMDLVQLSAGRLPRDPDEVITWPSAGSLGDTVVANGQRYEVVGHGGTLWWSDSDVLYAPIESVAGADGTNRLVVTAADDSETSLRSIADDIRATLEFGGDTYTTFPTYLPDGSTPIDEDIAQISTLIGLLGVFAGLVALVLLASTTNTLIVERTREVAVMRALGGRSRQLRRRLRRIAVGITAAALLIGLPLGILISNVIARMVLEEFVGVTPDVAVNWTVVALSAAGALLGARIVAARAARKVVKLPLAEALRDRDGSPFGRTWTHRLATRLPSGGLFSRLAARSSLHRPGHTVAVTVQIAAAVGAAFLIPSLASSVNAFNSAAYEPWSWESVTQAREPGLPFEATIADDVSGAETGIWVDGEIADWEVDVYGLATDTNVFDPMLTSGSWPQAGARELVLSDGFAGRNDIAVGDAITLELAAGPETYTVAGRSDDFARAVYVDRDVLAADLGTPGHTNVVWSDHAAPNVEFDTAVRTTTAADLAADDEAGRDAIVLIFGAIGVIVAGVASLAVMSSMMVSLFERRHELAALQAIGARRRRLRGLVMRELLPIATVGVLGGLALGALGTRGIIASFESSNAIDIGVVDAIGSIPAIVGGSLLVLVGLALVIVRSATRRPVTVTLRGAA